MTKIEEVGLSVRAINCLQSAGIKNIEELINIYKFGNFKQFLTEIEGLGKKTQVEIDRKVMQFRRGVLWLT